MLKIKNVSLSFGKHPILNNLNLDLKQGEIVGLVAPNGTGKSTLINVILNNLTPQQGKVEYNSVTYSSVKNEVELHQKICSFPDQNDLFSYMTGRDHLKLYANLWNNRKVSINEIIAKLQMQNYIDKKAGTYSLGMKQRLCFAMVVAADTPVMLLDEIMNGLDPQNVDLVSKVLIELKQSGKLLIIVSHHLQNLQLYADRVLFMKNGYIIKDFKLKTNTNLYIKFFKSNLLKLDLSKLEHLTLSNGLTLISFKKISSSEKETLLSKFNSASIPYQIAPISLEDLFDKYYRVKN